MNQNKGGDVYLQPLNTEAARRTDKATAVAETARPCLVPTRRCSALDLQSRLKQYLFRALSWGRPPGCGRQGLMLLLVDYAAAALLAIKWAKLAKRRGMADKQWRTSPKHLRLQKSIRRKIVKMGAGLRRQSNSSVSFPSTRGGWTPEKRMENQPIWARPSSLWETYIGLG